MSQIAVQQLLFEPPLDHVVNVASVRQLSPFRYPGGKTWLIPRIRRWLRNPPAQFIEPFAGGGIVSLTVAAENLAQHVTMVELDEQVAAVWQTIFTDGQADWLVEKIRDFNLTVDSLREELARPAESTCEKAFQTILKNRTFHGGILAAGAAPIKRGENGKGIQSRWYPETLSNRICELAKLRGRVTFIQGDGLTLLTQYATSTDIAFFIDPPYTAAGKRAGRRLYTHSDLDHAELFNLASAVAGDFLMTYENSEGMWTLARQHGFDVEPVAMKSNHHAEMTELLIGPKLDWARSQ